MVEEDALYRIMVPQPLPLSWGRTVQPYDPSISLLRRVRALHALHASTSTCAAFTGPVTGSVRIIGMGPVSGLQAEHAQVAHLLVQDPPTAMVDNGYVQPLPLILSLPCSLRSRRVAGLEDWRTALMQRELLGRPAKTHTPTALQSAAPLTMRRRTSPELTSRPLAQAFRWAQHQAGCLLLLW